VAAAFVLAVAAFLELLGHPADERTVVLRGYQWIAVGDLRVAFDLRFDQLSAVMALVVTGVSALIHLYSIGYMAGDQRAPTFFAYLNLFVAAMLILVLAQNFLVLFLGWEGVGVCSYLLIGFWFNRRLPVVQPGGRLDPDVPDETEEVWAPPAAKKAFLANRIGDVGFLLAMFLIFQQLGSLDFDDVLGRAQQAVSVTDGVAHLGSVTIPGLSAGAATAVALLLFLACAGKSAQIPLYVWLPDAMAGPTPVSALIHAATMVTAGVYLVARTHVLFEASETAGAVVVIIGALTAVLAAVIAIGQDDLKKILAYSTVSQLGYMFIAVGLGPIGYAAGLFHLVTHAFFKAQLFLGAGSVMHANADDTDVKHFGGLRRVMPLTWWTTVAAWLAIIGFPLTSGFYSKDQVLAAAFEHGDPIARFAWVVGLLTAGLTAFYMSRLVFLTFLGEPRWPEGRHPHESPPVMTVPLLVLGALALVAGVLLTGGSLVDGPFDQFLQPVLVGELPAPLEVESTGQALLLSVVVTLVAGVGLAIAWWVYLSGRLDWLTLRRRQAGAWKALANALYVNQAYELVTVHGGRALAAMADWVDRRVIDGAVDGLATAVGVLANRGRRLQTGLVRTYAVGVLSGAVLIVAVLVLRAV
jgi:NADH-quinone oxidoreductase subunit L